MKPVLAWVKANPMVVMFAALILIVLPVAYVMSSGWNKKIRTTQETAANAELGKIEKMRVNYTLPALQPGVEAVAYNGAPNAAMTAWFKENKDRFKGQADEVVRRAELFNKGSGGDAAAVGRKEHKPLVDGMFPDAGSALDDKLNEMEDALLGQRGWPNPYQELLKAVRAGGPADQVRIAEIIKDMELRESEKITTVKRELTAEEQKVMAKMLADRRMAEYKVQAKSISVYADISSLPAGEDDGVRIPIGKIPDPRMIEPLQFFLYQWDYWVLSDMFAVVRLANTTPEGRLTDVESSVVKRIEKVSIADPEGLFKSDVPGRGHDAMGEPVVPAAAVPGMVPLDPTLSITGRGMGTWNTVYDLRRAKIVAVVSSARLQDFLGAIAKTNFMTVIDLDLSEVDVWEDMRMGYFYGPEHVVRATVTVESVWLRSWMAPLMPKKLADLLGVPPPPEAAAAGQG